MDTKSLVGDRVNEELDKRQREFLAAQAARKAAYERSYKPYVPKNNSLAQANRQGLPHTNDREIARRLRQRTKN